MSKPQINEWLDNASDQSLFKCLTSLPMDISNFKQSHPLEDLSTKVRSLNIPDYDDFEGVKPFLEQLIFASDYLKTLMLRRPECLLQILAMPPKAAFESILAQMIDNVAASDRQADVMQVLRDFKADISLLIALCDIGGVWKDYTTTTALTLAADAAIEATLQFLLRKLSASGTLLNASENGVITDHGLFILAMGKHGAYELNYSSDVDLIIFYDPDKLQLKEGEHASKICVRLVQQMIKILQERTADGYVYRTDLRLRPDPGATAVAISINAAFNYYEGLAQQWERAAFIKARVCAGDIETGSYFLTELQPFIWRQYLDYNMLSEMRMMKRRIHLNSGFNVLTIKGHNVKLGRGGIRDIEFFTQAQQILAGGRDTRLRCPQTEYALNDLAEAGWIEQSTAQDMITNYWILRHVEHAIQMINDQQTHLIPEDEEEIRKVACLAGFESIDAFSETMISTMRSVENHYKQLFEAQEEATQGEWNFNPDHEEELFNTLSNLGYNECAQVIMIMQDWLNGRYASMRSEQARKDLQAILPILLQSFADGEKPEATVINFDQFLKKLPASTQLFSLLRSNPNLMTLLIKIMSIAPRMAEILASRPHAVDMVLDPAFFGKVPEKKLINDQLIQRTPVNIDLEGLLDIGRIFAQEQSYMLGTRLLTNTLTSTEASRAFTDMADVLIDYYLQTSIQEIRARHGDMPGGQVAILALGKLGSKEMNARSDLDLILLYNHDENEPCSDGEKSLHASQYYARLTQRLTTALSVPTAQGGLYEVDMRLRPSGKSGPLATHISSFIQYQQKEAWTWEHMSLTRGRLVAGSPELIATAEKAIGEVLADKRDEAKIKSDIANMRTRLERDKPAKSFWNLQHWPGGLVDIEFISQYMQLQYAHSHPNILSSKTDEALKKAQSLDLMDKAYTLIEAYNFYTSLIQPIKLCLNSYDDVETAPEKFHELLLEIAEEPGMSALEEKLKTMQSEVRHIVEDVIGKI